MSLCLTYIALNRMKCSYLAKRIQALHNGRHVIWIVCGKCYDILYVAMSKLAFTRSGFSLRRSHMQPSSKVNLLIPIHLKFKLCWNGCQMSRAHSEMEQVTTLFKCSLLHATLQCLWDVGFLHAIIFPGRLPHSSQSKEWWPGRTVHISGRVQPLHWWDMKLMFSMHGGIVWTKIINFVYRLGLFSVGVLHHVQHLLECCVPAENGQIWKVHHNYVP